MKDLKTIAVERLARQLQNLSCEFMIVPEEGDKIVNGKFTHYPKLRYGAMTGYVKEFIDPLRPGQSVEIPLREFAPQSVQSTATAYCSKTYGRGSHVSQLDAEKGILTVLCLDRDGSADAPEEDLEDLEGFGDL
jgi:hypothetical protein